MTRFVKHRQILTLLLAALLMRAGIPDGYMPSAPGSGMLFELCHSGVPAGFMTALAGAQDHHNDHMAHHDKANASESHFDTGQCPIGHLLSSAAAFDDLWQFDAIPESSDLINAPVLTHLSRAPANHRSRGPPT